MTPANCWAALTAGTGHDRFDFTIGLMIDGLVTPQLRLCESAHIRSAHTLKAPPCLLPAEQSMVVFKDQNALGGEACPTS